MNGSTQTVIGIDLGGTKIAAGVLALPTGDALARRVMATGARRGGPAVLDDVVALTRELATQTLLQGRSVDAVGLGICELVDRDGRIRSANCVDWTQLPVLEQLSSIAPATIEADVRAAAVAEGLFGAGKTFRVFLYVTIGTGISCCLMLDGAPYLGALGATGTMASSPLAVPCEACGHFSQRTLEEIAAGNYKRTALFASDAPPHYVFPVSRVERNLPDIVTASRGAPSRLLRGDSSDGGAEVGAVPGGVVELEIPAALAPDRPGDSIRGIEAVREPGAHLRHDPVARQYIGAVLEHG